MDIKISIVVPVYKVEKYLERCLDSIVNQTYQNLEIILIDDGSTDKSGEICDEYKKKDKRITVIHQVNAGLSGARNAGVDISTGEFIGFVDSDDYINERMYEVLLKNILEKKADISVCRHFRFSGEQAMMEKQTDWNINVLTSQEALINLHGMDGQLFTLAWNKLYRRELFIGLRYPLRKLNEDEFLTYKLIDRAKSIVVTDEILYYYFQNSDSITTNSKYIMSKDVFEALDERQAYFINKKNQDMIPTISKAYLDRAIARYGMLLKAGKKSQLNLNEIMLIYREYYKKGKYRVPGMAYKLFYFIPKVYFLLLYLKRKIK